jgi:hypothetical protein
MIRFAGIATVTVLLLGGAGTAHAQVRTPTQQEEDRCFTEEKHRDQLALRRFGQRTRSDETIREGCRAEVANAFDDRILGRPPMPGLAPIGIPLPAFGSPFGPASGTAPVGMSTGAVGTWLVIAGSWHHVGVETQPANRNAYFIDTNLLERGPIGAAWLTAVYERPYPDGAASTAYRVRVDCATGRWAYQYTGIRDAGFRVLRAPAPDASWRSPVTAPASPIARVRSLLCDNGDPGTPLGAAMPAPADWARAWFASNPR